MCWWPLGRQTGLFPELEPIQGQLLDSASALCEIEICCHLLRHLRVPRDLRRLATEEAGPRAMLGGLPATGPCGCQVKSGLQQRLQSRSLLLSLERCLPGEICFAGVRGCAWRNSC